MKRFVLTLCLTLLTTVLNAQFTSFTYQGRLTGGGNPLNGNYDLRFTVWNAESGPSLVSGTVGTNALLVSNGIFTVTLDFGVGVFNGGDRWLEISVRTNGSGVFDTLVPRQRLTATPYASTAGNVVSGGLGGTYGNALTFSNSANTINGSFNGNGAGISNVNALTLGGIGGAGFWKTIGNAGTAPGTNFLGTTDNQALEIQVNGTRAMRIEPHGTSAPSLAAGYLQNSVGSFHGATVAGGGTSGSPNAASGNYAFVGAGHGGLAADYSAVVAGAYNTSTGQFAFVGSGLLNKNMGDYAVIGGGTNNVIRPASQSAVIAGGENNFIHNTSPQATISGGAYNYIGTNSDGTVIAGGTFNYIPDIADFSTVGGGRDNRAEGFFSTIAGGTANRLMFGSGSFIGGGGFDGFSYSGNMSTGSANVVVGGFGNSILGRYASIGGGSSNIARGNASTVPGGSFNAALADVSFAAGNRAKANHAGSFVWSDSQAADFSSTTSDQFSVRARNGVRLETSGAGVTIDGQPLAANTAGNGLQLNSGKFSLKPGSTLTNDNLVSYAFKAFAPSGVWSGPIGLWGVGGTPANVGPNIPAGVFGESGQAGGIGVWGFCNGTGGLSTGVRGQSDHGNGVQGISTDGNGVQGTTTSLGSSGVYGENFSGYGVAGRSGDIGVAIYGDNPDGVAAQFNGKVTVNNYAFGGGITLDAAGNPAAYYLVDGATEHLALAYANGPGAYSADALTSDVVVRSTASRLLLQSGTGGAAITIATDNKVGIGTSVPSKTLDVRDRPGLQSGSIHIGGTSSGGDPKLIFFGDGAFTTIGENGADDQMHLTAATFIFTNRSGAGRVGVGRIPVGNKLEVEGEASKSTAGSWFANSDRRIKTAIQTITNALEKIDQVRLAAFRYTEDYRAEHPSIEDHTYVNVIAQEFQKVFPESVKVSGDRLTNGDEILQVDTYPLTIYSAAAVQELHRKMQKELDRRDAENAELKKRLAALEAVVVTMGRSAGGRD